MLERKYLRDCPELAKQALALRGAEFPPLVDRFVEIDDERRKRQQELDALKSERNNASKQTGELIKSGQHELAEDKRAYAKTINERIAQLEASHAMLEDEDRDILLNLPNLPHHSVPVGGEDKAELVKTWGEPRSFDFPPRDHVELCARLGLVNFEAGVRLAGSGFPVMHGAGALLQRALINLMLDTHVVRHGYTELRPPFIVHPRCPEGTGQLPKFGGEMYHAYIESEGERAQAAGPHYYLIPTAEVPVVNYYRDTILEAPVLPVKLCAYSPCWRVEAGSYGKEVRGLTRLHQFEKVELVRVADPARSYDDLEEMTAEAEFILEALGLAYRRRVLPTGDMAFASAKTYDIEVYCPAEQAWREVSSASNTTDYQARRANIRLRRERGGKPEFPHLLNASGLALPRLVIALLETHQTREGNLTLPPALRKYMPDRTVLTPQEGGAPVV
jgi:seryl-tRNA synthetase